jgi:hypothetical protein
VFHLQRSKCQAGLRLHRAHTHVALGRRRPTTLAKALLGATRDTSSVKPLIYFFFFRCWCTALMFANESQPQRRRISDVLPPAGHLDRPLGHQDLGIPHRRSLSLLLARTRLSKKTRTGAMEDPVCIHSSSDCLLSRDVLNELHKSGSWNISILFTERVSAFPSPTHPLTHHPPSPSQTCPRPPSSSAPTP